MMASSVLNESEAFRLGVYHGWYARNNDEGTAPSPLEQLPPTIALAYATGFRVGMELREGRTLAERILKLRLICCLSRADLAERVEHNPCLRTIARIERGRRPTYQTVRRLADAFRVPVELLSGDPSHPTGGKRPPSGRRRVRSGVKKLPKAA
jgi:hypothetical protein